MGGTSSAAPQSPPLPPWHAKIFMTRVSVIRSHSWFANSLDASRPCCCFLTAAQPREVSAGHFKSWNPEPIAAVLQLAGLSCVRPGYPAARSALAPVRKVSRRRVGRDLQATVFALRPTATWHRCHLAKNCGVRPKAPLRWRSSCRTLPRRGRVFSLRQRTSFGHRQPAGTSPPRRRSSTRALYARAAAGGRGRRPFDAPTCATTSRGSAPPAASPSGWWPKNGRMALDRSVNSYGTEPRKRKGWGWVGNQKKSFGGAVGRGSGVIGLLRRGGRPWSRRTSRT